MSTLAEALAPRSDQLNADDLIPGPRVLKITGAKISSEERQKRVVLNFEGDQGKPFKPCKTMGRAMVLVWAITDEKQLIGKSIRVYRDPQVKFGDQGEVGGIRISHMSDIDKPASVKLTVSQGKKAVFTFHPLVTDVPNADKAADPASKWAAAYIAKLPTFLTTEELNEFASEKAVKLEELRDKRPELHAQVTTALAKRSNELGDNPFSDQPAAGAPPASAPETTSAAEQAGAADTSDPAAKLSADLIAEINAAETPGEVERILTKNATHLDFMATEIADEVNYAADAKKAALGDVAANG